MPSDARSLLASAISWSWVLAAPPPLAAASPDSFRDLDDEDWLDFAPFSFSLWDFFALPEADGAFDAPPPSLLLDTPGLREREPSRGGGGDPDPDRDRDRGRGGDLLRLRLRRRRDRPGERDLLRRRSRSRSRRSR